jgi:predicted ATPase/class 3 adenylate cyclase
VTVRPTGTVSFLFTDIESSTRLLRELGDRYRGALDDHRRLLRGAFSDHGGYEVDTQGDAFFVAFARAQDAVAAAAQAQCALAAHGWPEGASLRVRMGIHTCEATPTDEGYVGIGVHRGARVAAAGHGGQVLLSQTTRDLLEDAPEAVAVLDLGEHRLKDLTQPQRLYQLLGEGLEREFPALKTLEGRPTNLPTQPTPLVGRVRELDRVGELLRGARVVTLTGPGGTGKTRLALQAAAELLDELADGAFFVGLATVTDPTLVLPAVSQTLGVTSAGIQTLEGYLSDKELLLVLDNLEQLVDAAPALAHLSAQGPRVKLLATSREPLHLAGEQVYPVPPLELEHEAVELFVERAQAAQPDFALTAENAGVVHEVCRRLDGLPLAVELAAARVTLLTPEALLERLDDRLGLLTGGARDLPERQRTLRATLEWSYDLLSVPEQRLFVRLAVFSGGFTLEAAEALADASLDDLASLVDKSLVRHDEGRYSMLETIHAYALERLTEADGDIRARHAEYFLALAEEAYAGRLAGASRWSARLEEEHDNLRLVLDNFRERHDPRELELAGALGWFWLTRSHLKEGRDRLLSALESAPREPPAPMLARALRYAGSLEAMLGETTRGIELLEESLSLRRSLGLEADEASTTCAIATAYFFAGEDAQARRYAERALTLQRKLGGVLQVIEVMSMLTQILVAEGDVEHAEPLAREVLEQARQLDSVRIEHFAEHYLGDCALIRGEPRAAWPHYRRSLETAVELGDRLEICFELQGLAMAAAGEGDLEYALRIAGAADGEVGSLGADISGISFWVELLDRYIDPARAELGPEAEVAWAEGCAFSLDEAVRLALERD